MMTLRQFAAEPATIPTRASWYLTDLAEAKGKYELYIRQSPQKLKVLREHALIESAVSSNRIEGVEVDQSRVATLMFGKPALRDRDEELVEHAIQAVGGEFGIADLERRCPGVSRNMIRHLLRDLKAAGRVECLGRGPGAKWRNKGNTLERG